MLLLSQPVFAVKESRLWLAKKQMYLMPHLLAAARLAEENADCVEVVNGQIDRLQSTREKPVFRIDCRNLAGVTYSLRTRADELDGRPELLRTVVKEKRKDKVNPIDAYRGWQICEIAIKENIVRMLKPKMLDYPMPVPHVSDMGESTYYVDFDAQTPKGDPVYYVSVCSVLPSGKESVEVKPRKAVKKPAGFDVKRVSYADIKAKPSSLTRALKAPESPGKADSAPVPIESNKGSVKQVLEGVMSQKQEDQTVTGQQVMDQSLVRSHPKTPAKADTAKDGQTSVLTADGWQVLPSGATEGSASTALTEKASKIEKGNGVEKVSPPKPIVTEDGWELE
jgi:hypothetical protein